MHKETGDPVAIKMIQKKDLDSESLKNILTEIKVSTNLEHPNIVKLVEVFESPTSFFLIFELMQGGEVESIDA